MLEVGCWMWDVGGWVLDVGCWRLVVCIWLLDVGRWTLDVGCWMLDVGCWIFRYSVPLPGGAGVGILSPTRQRSISTADHAQRSSGLRTPKPGFCITCV